MQPLHIPTTLYLSNILVSTAIEPLKFWRKKYVHCWRVKFTNLIFYLIMYMCWAHNKKRCLCNELELFLYKSLQHFYYWFQHFTVWAMLYIYSHNCIERHMRHNAIATMHPFKKIVLLSLIGDRFAHYVAVYCTWASRWYSSNQNLLINLHLIFIFLGLEQKLI